MNIRELTTLDHIMGFKGEYAVFKALENGRATQGLINRKGEIVWDAHSTVPILKVTDTIFMGRPMESHSLVCYDIVSQKIVERPACKLLIDGGYFLRNKENKWASFIDEKQVTDFIYDDIIRLENLVPTKQGKNLCVRQGDKSFYIDKQGNRISKEYDYLEPCTQSNYALAKIDGKIWVIDGDENSMVATKWEDTWCKIEGQGETYHYGLKWITPDMLLFAEGEKWGIMDIYGAVILPAEYEWISAEDDYKSFILKKDGLCGVMSKEAILSQKQDWLIPCIYQYLFYRDGFYAAHKDDKKGVIDAQGKIIIPFEYDSLVPARDEKLDLVSVKKDGECFFINAKQEKIDLF